MPQAYRAPSPRGIDLPVDVGARTQNTTGQKPGAAPKIRQKQSRPNHPVGAAVSVF